MNNSKCNVSTFMNNYIHELNQKIKKIVMILVSRGFFAIPKLHKGGENVAHTCMHALRFST